jgi:hypothetical protein
MLCVLSQVNIEVKLLKHRLNMRELFFFTVMNNTTVNICVQVCLFFVFLFSSGTEVLNSGFHVCEAGSYNLSYSSSPLYKFLCKQVFLSLGCTATRGIAGQCGSSMINVLRHCQALFHSDCITLHFHLPGIMAPTLPLPAVF